MGRRQGLAADDELADAAQVSPVLVDHEVEQRCRQPEGVHFLGSHERAEALERDVALFVDDTSTSAQQRTPDLEGRGVEGEWRHVEERAHLVEADVVHAEEPSYYRSVLDNPVRNAGQLWLPGRGPVRVYIKRRLVPFGEVIPLRGVLSKFISLIRSQ